MPVDGGWTWKFDEDLLTSLTDAERKPEEFQALTTTLGVIFGADSELFSRRTLEYMQELIPSDLRSKKLPTPSIICSSINLRPSWNRF